MYVKTKNKRPEKTIIRNARNTKRKRRGFPRIIFTYPPKKSFFKLKRHEFVLQNEMENTNNNKNILITNKTNSFKLMNKNKKNININININNQIFEAIKIKEKEKEQLDNYELNNLEYDSAIIIDKRNFIEIYWSLLKREHLVIFTFITKDDII